MKNNSYLQVHPLIIFWLGVLTGAIIVGLVFFYKFLTADDYASSLLKTTTKSYSIPSVKSGTSTLQQPGYFIEDPTGG